MSGAANRKAKPGKPIDLDHGLELVERIAIELEAKFKYSTAGLEANQLERIWRLLVTMTKCLNLLARKASEGDPQAVAALARHISDGCLSLRELSESERGNDLKTVARFHSEWPVLLSLKDDSFADAKEYLRRLGVGMVSNPPTASRMDVGSLATQYASYLIEKIASDRDFLANSLPSNPVVQEIWLRAENQPSAQFRERILALPPLLNGKSCARWWAVAKDLLKAHFAVNPAEADAFFRSVKISAEGDGVSSKTYAIKLVAQRFKAIASNRDNLQ